MEQLEVRNDVLTGNNEAMTAEVEVLKEQNGEYKEQLERARVDLQRLERAMNEKKMDNQRMLRGLEESGKERDRLGKMVDAMGLDKKRMGQVLEDRLNQLRVIREKLSAFEAQQGYTHTLKIPDEVDRVEEDFEDTPQSPVTVERQNKSVYEWGTGTFTGDTDRGTGTGGGGDYPSTKGWNVRNESLPGTPSASSVSTNAVDMEPRAEPVILQS